MNLLDFCGLSASEPQISVNNINVLVVLLVFSRKLLYTVAEQSVKTAGTVDLPFKRGVNKRNEAGSRL